MQKIWKFLKKVYIFIRSNSYILNWRLSIILAYFYINHCKVPSDIETNTATTEVFFDLSEGTITSYMDVMTVGTTPLHAESCSCIHARKERNENPC